MLQSKKMKSIYTAAIALLVLASCGSKTTDLAAQLAKLKVERQKLDDQIRVIEAKINANNPPKGVAVSAITLQPKEFSAAIVVQANITGDENVVANSQAPGTVTRILVHPGQKVSRGQTLAYLDSRTIDQQINALQPGINLRKTLYEKQQKLWKQGIGTEVQLMTAKTEYESMLSQKSALQANRDLYRIVSPISGTVDAVDLKVGDVASPGSPVGIRVVSFDKLKAESELGQGYLGKVNQGDPVVVRLSDINDSIEGRVSYVGRSINATSKTFTVQVKLGNNAKLRPNMSAQLIIDNYKKANSIVIPISVVQNTADGDMVFVVREGKAQAVFIEVGVEFGGEVEVLKGLSSGDVLVTEGYLDLDNGEKVNIQS